MKFLEHIQDNYVFVNELSENHNDHIETGEVIECLTSMNDFKERS